MPEYSLEPRNDLIVGMTGSGKTTLVIRLLINSRPACRFIFDDENRTAPRLKIKPCFTERELEESLSNRWVVFNPVKMFPPRDGDRDLFAPKKRAFNYFCAWIFHVCGRGPGVKMISLPEIWRFCTPDSIPPAFASLTQMGRELNTHLIMDTQRPEQVNPSVIGASTELICFKLISPQALRSVETLGADRAKVAALPLGHFLSYNRLSGGTLAGRMF